MNGTAPTRMPLDHCDDSPTLNAVLGEVLARRRAASSLGHYVQRTSPFILEPWQWILCNRLSRLPHQKGQRLLIHGPPQFGKSLILSQRFPSWVLGVAPTHRVRLACYNQTHAKRFSKVNIDLMHAPDYARVFPSPDSAIPSICPVEEWSTAAREALRDANPSFKALGLGSGFTGMGADLALIDDPYKNRQEAFSTAINEGIWNWYTTVLLSRCNPDTNIVVLFHRWQEDDLAGRLMAQGGWEVLRFSAIGDGAPDDPMGRAKSVALSSRYPLEYLRRIEQEQGELNFLALYQGAPTAAGGTIFKSHHFLPVQSDGSCPTTGDELQFWPWPEGEEIQEAYLSGDTAVTGRTQSDDTALCLSFLASDGYIYLYPLVLARMDIDHVVKNVALQWAKTRSRLGEVLHSFQLEEGSAGTPAILMARKLMLRARARPTPEQFALDAAARQKSIASRSPGEKAAMKVVADFYPPSDIWSADEWESVRQAPPLVLAPYRPGELQGGGTGDIVARAHQITPTTSGKAVRLCADGANWAVARAWLHQLMALPNGRKDDAVQSTIGAVLPFVQSLSTDEGTNGESAIAPDLISRVFAS